MSFLLGDDYASSSSSESDSEEDVPVANQADKHSDAPSTEVPTLLPSADSVLDSVGSTSKRSFLPPTHSDTPKQVIEVFDRTKEAEAAAGGSEDAHDNAADQAFVSSRPPPRQQRKPQDQQTVAHAAKRPLAADKSGPPNKREKMDGKERVKAQRVKGQAGIGSDFRHWKSETEMAMRQQFD